MVARGRIKAPKYLGVFKSVNPPGVPADLKSAVKKGSTYKHRGICNPPINVNVYSYLVFLSMCYFEINISTLSFKMKDKIGSCI